QTVNDPDGEDRGSEGGGAGQPVRAPEQACAAKDQRDDQGGGGDVRVIPNPDGDRRKRESEGEQRGGGGDSAVGECFVGQDRNPEGQHQQAHQRQRHEQICRGTGPQLRCQRIRRLESGAGAHETAAQQGQGNGRQDIVVSRDGGGHI